MRQSQEVGEALPQRRVAGDLAADIADHPTEPGAQELEFAPRPLELMGMSVAPDHDRRALGYPPIALPQRHIVAPRQIDQLFQRPWIAVRRSGGRSPSAEPWCRPPLARDPWSPAPGLVRHRQALLEQRDQLLLAQALPPMRQRGAVERQFVTEAQFAAEKLVIRVLQPARAQHLVRQVVHVLQDEQTPPPAASAAAAAPHPPRTPRQTARRGTPNRSPGQPHQRMAEVDDRLQRRPQQILLTIVPRLRHRAPQR